MKILLWIHRSKLNAKGVMPIMMRITINGQRINFPTQITIEEKLWDRDKQAIKGNSELIQKYNQFITTLKTKAWEFYNNAQKEDRAITPLQ